VEFAPEILRNTDLRERPDFFEHRRVLAIQLMAVFLVSYLFLFFGMMRRPGMYDEGIVLTGAMRVASGQIPHRDFYFIYGPAEIYVLAGLFKAFGPSVLAERLFDLSIKALVVTSVFGIVAAYCRKSVAVFISIITILWLFGLNEFGLAVMPVSVLNLISSVLILPMFEGRLSAKRMMAAGAVAGAATLFRYDTGIALLGINACLIAVAIYLQPQGTANRPRLFVSAFWPYLAGFGLVVLLPVVYYLSVAPLGSIAHDIIVFPRKYYYRSRNLPFPRITPRYFENIGIYLPLAIAAMTLYALGFHRLRRSATGSVEERRWEGFLITFGLMLAVMYLKGIVRIAPIQMYLAIVPSLLLIAVLFEHRTVFPRLAQVSINCLMLLSFLAATWSALHVVRLESMYHLSVAQRILHLPPTATPGLETAWCNTPNPVTRGFCFLPEDDRLQAIEFIRSHTHPGQTLYSGLRQHDRVFANDNLIYFATQLLPATRWSHFDPDLQNRYDIQTQMVQELKQNAPPYLVLDSEFDLVREPNASSKSSGVTLLDTYIRDQYKPVEQFDKLSIWQRQIP
jgi:hypothetical protein